MATLKDIAKHAGVNTSTVSRALRGSNAISSEMKEKILKIAEDLDYIPPKRQKAYGAIGIIVPEVVSGYYSDLVTQLENCIYSRDYFTTVAITHFDAEKAASVFKLMASQGIQGIIIDEDAFVSDKAVLTQIISETKIPTVLLSNNDVTYASDTISTNYVLGIRYIIEHFLELGHTSVGYIGEYYSGYRLAAFQKECSERNITLDPNHIFVGSERFEEGGYRMMKKVIDLTKRPTAIFASYDQFAIGALKALSESALRVPDDISIASIDNINISKYLNQPLTTITNPVHKMSEVATRLLLNRIENSGDTVYQQVLIQPQLIVRDTTAKPRHP